MSNGANSKKESKIHLLDVGRQEYGDAVLCQFGKRTVLIDGAHPGDHDGSEGHPSIPSQIEDLLGEKEPFPIDLLIISHAHQDHIGCLPKLIGQERLKIGWILTIDEGLGWGRSGKDDRDSAALDERVLKLATALREEIHTERGTTDAELDQLLLDAMTLEDRYKKMLEDLEKQGTKIVRLGHPDTDLKDLTKEFADINFKILGPDNFHLWECAEEIGNKTRDAIKMASDFFSRDAGLNEIDIYRQLAGNVPSSAVGFSTDALDARSRPGPFINLQSIITQFEFEGHKFLFAGDFQFADPQTSNEEIKKGVEIIKEKIRKESPYSFVKISHHGSDNAFSKELFEDLGETKTFGLCAGEKSTKHPHGDVLKLLDSHKDEISWARTDHNGLVTLIYKKGKIEPEINLQKGTLNDAKPNYTDLTGSISGEEEAAATTKAPPVASSSKTTPTISAEKQKPASKETGEVKASFTQQRSDNEFIEITAKIPNTSSQIHFSGNFTIKVDSGAGSGKDDISPQKEVMGNEDLQYDPDFLIGGGRAAMKRLLFITSKEKLKANIGQNETQQILLAFEKQGIPIYSDLPSNLKKSAEATYYVRQKLADHPDTKGVVIIGGYDVVPSQILDSLPLGLRNVLPPNDDPDNFIVWNDEIYGDFDGDGLAEIPVSRIPDGKSAELVYEALQSDAPQTGKARFGIRNVARPFAMDIFDKIPGAERLLVSRDTVFDQNPPLKLEADQVYFMLHGDYLNSRSFWGEDTEFNREAFHVSNLPDKFKGVVFTGCCWGALTVDTPAGRLHPQGAFSQNTVESSIALSFLARGANAFVGCTGAHYSPVEPPFDYFGGPLHAAFWHFYNAGSSASEALFKAKIEYINQMPHGRTTPVQQAIEYKILRQFTCLGLGW